MGSPSVRVEKATSDLLIGPDWTMNMDICDSINSDHWQAKDVVKAVKKRLQNKNPKVQLLALTLLETLIKNCGDYVHFQVVERNILQEMIKIVRKKTDMPVRDKILVLLNSWQQAFGGSGGKYPQYFWAYDELRRSGVEFPQRSEDASPIFTPPITHPGARHSQEGYGLPGNSSRRLDETMAAEIEGLSLSGLNSIRSVMELLSDMLHAVNLNDREAVKDEVIVDLVDQCRSNQKKLVQLLNSTVDEELLGQGLALNDNLQSLLAKNDAIATGSPLPAEIVSSSPKTNASISIPVAASDPAAEEEEEDDDFAQLARRRSKSSKPVLSESTSIETSDLALALNPADVTAAPATASSGPLTLPDPPNPVKTAPKEQDMIDLLSSTLSTNSPHTPPSVFNQIGNQMPVSPNKQGYSYAPHPYPLNQGQVAYNSYVAPWAQPQSHPHQPQPHYSQPHMHPHPQSQLQPQLHPQSQPQPQQYQTQPLSPRPQPLSPQSQPQLPPQAQPHYPQPHMHPHPQPQLQPQVHPQSQPQPQQYQPQPLSPSSQAQPQPQAHYSQPHMHPHPQPQLQPQVHPQSQPQPLSPPPQAQPQPQVHYSQPHLHPHPQPQLQHQVHPHSQPQPQQYHSQSISPPQLPPQAHIQPQPQVHLQPPLQPQPQSQPLSSSYPPPPWEVITTASSLSATAHPFPISHTNTAYTPVQAATPWQQHHSFGARGNNAANANTGSRQEVGVKPFVPSNRLFEDLIDLRNADGGLKSGGTSSRNGSAGPAMIGGRK